MKIFGSVKLFTYLCPIKKFKQINNMRKYTQEVITELGENEVFVFGSNEAGLHGGGAARAARELFGAEMGVGVGITGRTYALPTLDGNYKKITRDALKDYIQEFYQYVLEHKNLTFLLTKIGCGIAGWDLQEVKDILWEVLGNEAPENLIFPIEFEK